MKIDECLINEIIDINPITLMKLNDKLGMYMRSWSSIEKVVHMQESYLVAHVPYVPM